MIVLDWINSAWCWMVLNLMKVTVGYVVLAAIVILGATAAIRHGEKQRHTRDSPDCECGCAYTVHEHYRPGTDCGHCGRDKCNHYRPVPQVTGQLIKPPVGTTVRIDGDESGRLVTYQPDGHWGPAVPEVKSCKRESG